MDQPPEGMPNPRRDEVNLVDPQGYSCLALMTFIIGVVSLTAFSIAWINSRNWMAEFSAYESGFFQFRIFFFLLVPFGWFIGFIALVRTFKLRKGRVFTYLGLFGCVCLTLVVFEIRDLSRKEIEKSRKIPGGYEYDFMVMKSWLSQYQGIHGNYPPALMPYWPMERKIKEATDRFPLDRFAGEATHRYYYDWIRNKWSNNDKPMKESPTTADFDPAGWYRYYSDGKGYIIIGNGPDGDADLDAKESLIAARNGNFEKLMMNKYDPTNGTDPNPYRNRSSGDYFVLRLR